MSRKITDFLKKTLSDGRLKPFQSFFVFGCSILVNAYFQVTSFSAPARWLLKISGAENVSEQLTLILSRTETLIGMRIVFGLLMTAFVMLEREHFISAIRKFMQMERLTAPLLRELIERIEVFETEGVGKHRTQRIVIYYRFVGYIELPEAPPRDNYKADTRKGVSIEYLPNPLSA